MIRSSNIIFLDIDGVLATDSKKSIYAPKDLWIKEYGAYPFDPACVKTLNEILDNVDADIVISSDWQKYFTLEQLKNIFKLNGVKKLPVDTTNQVKIKFSSSPMMDRVAAIKKYIKNDSAIIKYVVVDDLPMNDDFSKEVFAWCTDGVYGICEEGIKDKIILSLNY